MLKSFFEKEDYGFIKLQNEKDIFVHGDDLRKAEINTKQIGESRELRVSFALMEYIGHHKQSKKAVDIERLADNY